MAIETILVNTSDTALYTSISDSAITMMSLCNYGAAQISATMHIVKSGDTPGVHNLLIKDIIIPPSDTYISYHGGEKIILEDGDYVSAIVNVTNSVTSIVSFMVI